MPSFPLLSSPSIRKEWPQYIDVVIKFFLFVELAGEIEVQYTDRGGLGGKCRGDRHRSASSR